MAKPPAPIQPLQGLEEMRFLLEIVRDKDLLATVLDDIEAKRAQANEIVALIGPANEISAMHARAASVERLAGEKVKQAEAEAARILAAAQAEIDEQMAAADVLSGEARALQASAAEMQKAADQAMADAKAEIDGIAERERLAREAMSNAQRIIGDAEAAKALYEAKLSELQETLKKFGG